MDAGIGTVDVDVHYSGSNTPLGVNHPNNHNASPELHEFVRDMATMYNIEADPADQGSIGLNDMSLELGGLFDIQANWSSSPGHFRHRFGTDCDIDQMATTSSGTTVVDQATLKRIVTQELFGIFVKESKNRMHVQVPEDEVGAILVREAR